MNFQIVGFGVVLAIAGAGVDYFQQTQVAGVGFGQMGPGEYIATFSDRFESSKAEKQAADTEDDRARRWRAGALAFLPEAPEGWTRRSFTEGDNTAIRYPANATQAEGSTTAAVPLIKRGGVGAMEKQAKRLDKVAWVYERGAETVFVEVKLEDEIDLSTTKGKIAALKRGTGLDVGSYGGFGVIGGAAFRELFDHNGKRPTHYRVLRADIGLGAEIHLRVHANASSASTREVLQEIDFDGLNALLAQPYETVGKAITLPANLSEPELAVEMQKLRNAYLLLRVKYGAYTKAKASAKIGEDEAAPKEDLWEAIKANYRADLQELMAGRTADAAVAEMNATLDARIAEAEAVVVAKNAENQQDAEMTQALADELASGDGASKTQIVSVGKTGKAKKGKAPSCGAGQFCSAGN